MRLTGTWAGEYTYGVGYAIAALMSTVAGYVMLGKKLERLDFMTFTGQPLSESERAAVD